MEARMKLGIFFAALASAALCFSAPGHAQAVDATPIKIGVYLPLTGQNAFGGQLELEGVRLAQKEMPTVLNRPVELVVVDNKSDKVEAANAVKRLVERDKVVALIGSYGSSLAMAGAEVAEKAMIPGVGTSCTNPLVTQGKKYYFRIRSTSPLGTGSYSKKYSIKVLPPAPKTLKAKSTGNAVKLTYKPKSYATGYYIYRAKSEKGKYKLIANVQSHKTKTYTDYNVTYGKTYYYKIACYIVKNGKTYKSAKSAAVECKLS